MHSLYNAQKIPLQIRKSYKYKLAIVIFGNAHHILFKPVRIKKGEADKCPFRKFPFVLMPLTYTISFKSKISILPYGIPIDPYYTYSKIVIYKNVLNNLISTLTTSSIINRNVLCINFSEHDTNFLICTCPNLLLATLQLNIINTFLRDLFTKGPNYREPKSITCIHTLPGLWILSRIIPDSAQRLKENKHRYSFRIRNPAYIYSLRKYLYNLSIWQKMEYENILF